MMRRHVGLFHDQERYKPGDLRRRLIEHALDPEALTRELERAERRAESEFDRQVIRRFGSLGH